VSERNYRTKLENFYRQDGYEGFGGNFNPAAHAEYANFVAKEIGGEGVLEIGSGLGAAALAMHERGCLVTASDLYPDLARRKFAEIGSSVPVLFLNAGANHLPDSTVANYALYQVLEHLAEPQACFQQAFRTLRPGGRLFIVSPNLLSPLASAQVLVKGLSGRWQMPWHCRTDGYTFPFGSTVSEAFAILCRNVLLAFALRLGPKRPRFRTPCLRKPAQSDSDAVFLAEPLTVRAMLREEGFEILSFQRERRTGTWGGSVWICARKPGAR
jgi:SAM-dependent methyltransferase